jgi:hypothetical protein
MLTVWVAAPNAQVRTSDHGSMVAAESTPTAGQIQSLVARVVKNQHINDRALEEFERIERVVSRKGGDNSAVLFDRTDRVMPSGTGVMRLRIADDGEPVSQDLYRSQLHYAVKALDLALHPDDRWNQDLAKFERRRRERAKLVDATAKAFRFTWAGREKRGSQTIAKLDLDPDPDFSPASRLEATFEHAHAVLWVEESQAQIVRIEGDITTDITFGGGVVGKVYHGGHFVMEQAEVAPGIWEPTFYTYDVDGRKFVFGFGLHERIEVSRYHHVGPPAKSIEIVRDELNKLLAQGPTR